MPENVSIAYRGANFAIGQGPQFYGIWHAAAPQPQPVEWWPLTPEGWSGAWARFASIEVPGTIAAVTQQPAAPDRDPARAAGTARIAAARIAAAVLGLGVVLGIVGLFPAYVAGASLASQPSDLVSHVIYLAAWSASAVLIALGGTRLRVGALMGLGVSAVTFGLFFADAGTPMASGARLMGAGLVLGIAGWLACAAGVGLAFRASPSGRERRAGNGVAPGRGLASRLGRAPSHEIVPLVTLVLAALGAAIAFAPSWDRFVLQTANGISQVITEGNAFANPAAVIVGDVLVMVALVAVIAVAALRRPLRLGAALAAGAIIPMVAQAISAIVQIHGSTSPLLFGISAAQATAVGLTISAGLTAMFWVFCAFLATLILLSMWMLLAPEPEAPQHVAPYQASPYSVAPAAAAGPDSAASAGVAAGAADYTDAARLQTGTQ